MKRFILNRLFIILILIFGVSLSGINYLYAFDEDEAQEEVYQEENQEENAYEETDETSSENEAPAIDEDEPDSLNEIEDYSTDSQPEETTT